MNPRVAESGMALVVALLLTLLMSTLAVALVMTTTTDTLVAGAFASRAGALAAADAGLARVMRDLSTMATWDAVIDGSTRSSFTDGPPSGIRSLADGRTIDLTQIRNQANCGKATTCTASDLSAVTDTRPWAANNPVWQLYAYGRMADVAGTGRIDSPYYLVVFVGDDPGETDGNPWRDAAEPGAPGGGVVALRAEAFGPVSVHRVVEATVARPVAAGVPGLEVRSWREVR